MRFVFLVLVVVPLVELMVLIKVGGLLGVLPTLALVVGTAAVGWSLVHSSGRAVLARMRASVAAGQLPARELMEAMLLVCCGALLLAPGLLTDTLALCVLIPGVRSLLVAAVTRWMSRQNGQGAGFGGTFSWSAQEVDVSMQNQDAGSDVPDAQRLVLQREKKCDQSQTGA